jgi:pimeloyl-ACP methyl ester carboxylesterase
MPAADRYAATGHVVTRDGVGLFCRDWGAGPPVVFLASWSLPSDSWAYQMATLAEAGLRCVAYDRRGHGRSADPGRGYEFDTLADDLADVLDVLNLAGVTLVTFSAGAGEAVRYLTRHGRRRVARLALVGPTTPLLARTADNPDGIDPAVLEAFRRDELLQDWPRWLDENAWPFAGPDASEAMLAWLKGMALQASLHALAAFNRELTTADFRAELPRLDLPVLVSQGDRDATCPLDLTGRRTAALVPGARLLVYEGAPHGVPVSHAERLSGDLLRFVQGG